MDESLKSLFDFETTQLIHGVEDIILNAETNHELLKNKIEDIFRTMHTIKGGAGMMSYAPLQTLSHALEDLFHFLRDNPEAQYEYEELTDILLSNCDFFLRYLESPNLEITTNLARVQNFLASFNDKKPSLEIEPIRKKVDLNDDKKRLIVFFKSDTQMIGIRAFELANTFTKLSLKNEYSPAYGAENAEKIIISSGVSFTFNNEEDLKKASEIVLRNSLVSRISIQEPNKENEEAKIVYLPVAKTKLDKLLDLMCEIVDDYNSIKNTTIYNDTLYHLEKVFNELQDVIISTRMTGISETLNKMRRFIYDVAHTLNKKVNFEIIADDIEIDRAINEVFFVVLTQVVKNAVDHGIEDSQERIKKGKDPVGSVTISAKLDGRNVVVEVKDDGRGFDKEKIISIALEKKLIDVESLKTLSDSEIYELTYNSGFTTKDTASEISGRGVGMDIVQNSIRSVRGNIFIESIKDLHTIVTLVVPLTLTIVDVFVVEVNESKIAIPVDEIEKIYAKSEITVKNDSFKLNEKEYKLIDFLHFFPSSNKENLIIATLNTKFNRAVLLPNIIKYAKVIVKPSPDLFATQLGVNGLATLEGGESCLVVSLHKMIRNIKRGKYE